jgi:hypothetical protein
MKLAFALIATLMAIIGNVPYLLDIIKKKIQPHPYTWFVWTIVSGVTFFGALAKGAGIGALPTLGSEIFTFIIFFMSLRYGFKGITKTDKYFLIAALVSLIPWLLTKDPTLSVIIVVCIDLIAFVPTLRKTWVKPQTENPILFAMNVLRHILTIFSLGAYNIATMLHSVAMIIVNSLMTGMILRKYKKD